MWVKILNKIKKILVIIIVFFSLFVFIDFILFQISDWTILDISKKEISDFCKKKYSLNIEDQINLKIFYNNRNLIDFDHKQICMNQVPQGITIYRNSFVFTTYCSTGKHNSAIYIVNAMESKRIELEDKSHLGGITYDSKNKCFWICLDDANIAKISESLLNANYDSNITTCILKYDEMEIYHIDELESASYITYYNDRLYVGEFSMFSGKLCSFAFIADGKLLTKTSDSIFQSKYPNLKPISTVITPAKIQGITFDNSYIYMSQSFGRQKDSKILKFRHLDDFSDYTSEELLETKVLPPLLEEISYYNGNIYCLFESAANKYKNTTKKPIDKIIKINSQ